MLWYPFVVGFVLGVGVGVIIIGTWLAWKFERGQVYHVKQRLR